MKEITIAAIFVKMITEGAEKQGINCEPILLRNGISQLSLNRFSTDSNFHHEHRVRLDDFAKAAREIMLELDCELLGLTQVKQPIGSFAMMCRASISAHTIKRSLRRCANFWNLFHNTFEHRLLVSSGRAFYEIALLDDNITPLNNYAVESMLSATHRFHCWLAGQFIPLTSISVDFAEPYYSSEYKPLFYGTPIKYNQPCASIEFETRYLNLDIVQTPETLDQYLAGTNLSLLYQPKNYRVISDQVRQWLEKNIKQGNYSATLKEAASHFHLSQQVLHRRLRAEDTSFKEIKMQTRRDMAINLLFSKKTKIEDIAQQVGFSEPSAFIRAFKAWTGLTPLNYRQQSR